MTGPTSGEKVCDMRYRVLMLCIERQVAEIVLLIIYKLCKSSLSKYICVVHLPLDVAVVA